MIAASGPPGWRLPALLAAAGAVVAAGAVIALLQPAPPAVTWTRRHRPHRRPRARRPVDRPRPAACCARRSRPARRRRPGGGTLELITGPGQLTAAQLAQAAGSTATSCSSPRDVDTRRARGRSCPAPCVRSPGDAVRRVRAADRRPARVRRAGRGPRGRRLRRRCRAAPHGARRAVVLPGRAAATALVSYQDGGRTITVIGSGAPLTNGYLADARRRGPRPEPARGPPGRSSGWCRPPAGRRRRPRAGQQSFFSLVPWPVYLIAIQLCVAALLAAAWRARRLGPLVAERLPVAVRASETVEGHGRLYQARRARDRAAGELRAAASARHRPPGPADTGARIGGDRGPRGRAAGGRGGSAVARPAARHRPGPGQPRRRTGHPRTEDTAVMMHSDPALKRSPRSAPRSPRPSSARTRW